MGAGRNGCGPGPQGDASNVDAVTTQEAGAPRNDGTAQSVASTATFTFTFTFTFTLTLIFINDDGNISGVDSFSVVVIFEVALGVSAPCGDSRGRC